jgi:hypothetical protein
VEFLHGLLVAFVWLWEAGFVWAAQENVQWAFTLQPPLVTLLVSRCKQPKVCWQLANFQLHGHWLQSSARWSSTLSQKRDRSSAVFQSVHCPEFPDHLIFLCNFFCSHISAMDVSISHLPHFKPLVSKSGNNPAHPLLAPASIVFNRLGCQTIVLQGDPSTHWPLLLWLMTSHGWNSLLK